MLNLFSDCIQSIGLKNEHLSHIARKNDIPQAMQYLSEYNQCLSIW